MRPAVRLSALTSLPVVWVWTHDSVGLGEDGPTHQPIEHYAALRAIPNLWFVRPADANETAVRVEGRARARGRAGRRSRSRGRRCRRSTASELAPASGLERGAYALWDSGDGDAGPDPDRDRLRGRRSRSKRRGSSRPRTAPSVRVVSMPCWELFEAQPSDYRDEVLPPRRDGARLAVEAGRRARLAALGRRRAATRSRSTASARRRRATRCSSGSATPSTTSSRARDGAAASASRESRGRVRPPRRPPARRRSSRHSARSATTSSTSAPTPTPSRIDYPDKARELGEAMQAATPSAACSSAAPASARAVAACKMPASAPRSATTPTRRTRASSTTT